jgi:chemotaxis regulatin CheY-phosphate phosphatase CheZ
MQKGMTQLQVNHLEIAARTFAAEKAREIGGVAVDNALNQTQATILDPALIQSAEEHMRRFLSAWLRHSLVEFVRGYMSDVEERAAQVERTLHDVMAALPTPPIVK